MLHAIGHTPLIKLKRLPEPNCATIYVKYEGSNPTGSMKDRMALSMIESAEKRGQLRQGGRIVEFTGGSTGSAIAMVGAAKGYQVYFLTSNAFSKEKRKTMKAFGAELELVHSEDGKISAELIAQGLKRIAELSREPNTFWTDQFNNVDNRQAYHQMAREVLDTLDGKVDEFVAGIGTGGCFSGNAEAYKEALPDITCTTFEPYHVRALTGGNITGGHRLEGMGLGYIPSICRMDLADRILAVKDEDAMDTARKLASQEGILGGISSGANVWTALQRARELGPGKNIVTVICDTRLKYFQGDLFG